jgi:hypothetical protein
MMPVIASHRVVRQSHLIGYAYLLMMKTMKKCPIITRFTSRGSNLSYLEVSRTILPAILPSSISSKTFEISDNPLIL